MDNLQRAQFIAAHHAKLMRDKDVITIFTCDCQMIVYNYDSLTHRNVYERDPTGQIDFYGKQRDVIRKLIIQLIQEDRITCDEDDVHPKFLRRLEKLRKMIHRGRVFGQMALRRLLLNKDVCVYIGMLTAP